MALNIKNPEVEELATEVAKITGESKTEAIRQALIERKGRLQDDRKERLEATRRWLREEVWPSLPPDQLGRRLTKAEEEEILGFGPEGF